MASRNDPTLINAVFYDWFGWGGRGDSVWLPGLGTIEAPTMGGTRLGLMKVLTSGSPGTSTRVEATSWTNSAFAIAGANKTASNARATKGPRASTTRDRQCS